MITTFCFAVYNVTTVSHGSKRHRLTRGHRSTAKEANKTNKYIRRRHRREKGNFIKVYDSDIPKKYILREDRKMLVSWSVGLSGRRYSNSSEEKARTNEIFGLVGFRIQYFANKTKIYSCIVCSYNIQKTCTRTHANTNMHARTHANTAPTHDVGV